MGGVLGCGSAILEVLVCLRGGWCGWDRGLVWGVGGLDDWFVLRRCNSARVMLDFRLNFNKLDIICVRGEFLLGVAF